MAIIQMNSEKVRLLANSTYVVETAAGSVLVNCPPETLKALLAANVKPPKIILLPPDIPAGQQLGSSGFVRLGINYASVEFVMFANFFTGGLQRTRLVTVTAGQAQRLEMWLQETIQGPTDPALYAEYPWLQHECAAISYFPPMGRQLQVRDFADIVSLEENGGDLGSGVTVRLADGKFEFLENGAPASEVPTEISKMAAPLILTPPYPLHRQEITLQFVGASDGFDPGGITTCFLAYLGTGTQNKATLFDTAAYLRLRLGNLGVSPRQISEVVLSHVHEDHLAGLFELLLMGEQRIRLITSDIIYASLLSLLAGVLGISEKETAGLFDFYPLNPGHPLVLEDRTFEAIYATHTVPTLAVRVNGLCYSGDMRYDEEWFAELEKDGVISAERRAELVRFAEGAKVLVQDVGGGAVHTTLTPEVLSTLAAKSQRLVLAHTSKHLLPDNQSDLTNKIEFASSGHVTALGDYVPTEMDSERLETISACPLFARLSIADRTQLAQRALVMSWEPGRVIVRDGDRSDGQTYIVHTGLVEVWNAAGLALVIGRGTSVGERGALQGEMRTGTMIARGPVQLLGFSREVFGPVAEKLGLASAFDRADWLWRHPTFAHLAWGQLLDLALDFRPIQLPPGDRLFTINDVSDDFFMLVSGSIALESGAGELIGELTAPGEFFGGRGAILGTPRNTTAYATTPSSVWALPAPALQRLQFVYPNLALHLRSIEMARQGHAPLIPFAPPAPPTKPGA